jgi:hypothetical protein
MKPAPNGSGYVCPSGSAIGIAYHLVASRADPFFSHVSHIVDSNLEGEFIGHVLDDKDRPNGQVPSRDDPMEIDERGFSNQCLAKADILVMVRVGASISV